MSDMIDDNRFVMIEKYKQRLVEGTNIESRPEEMAVIDSILFRFWQMGWLDKLEQSELHWIPVEQGLPEKEGKYLCTRTATWSVDGKATKVTDIAILDYSDNIYDIWKDDGEIFQNGFAFGEMWQGKLDNVQKVSAWMPLPKPFKGVTDDRF